MRAPTFPSRVTTPGAVGYNNFIIWTALPILLIYRFYRYTNFTVWAYVLVYHFPIIVAPAFFGSRIAAFLPTQLPYPFYHFAKFAALARLTASPFCRPLRFPALSGLTLRSSPIYQFNHIPMSPFSALVTFTVVLSHRFRPGPFKHLPPCACIWFATLPLVRYPVLRT